jgi:glycosyltransferase involved in cell wall biosynthesis
VVGVATAGDRPGAAVALRRLRIAHVTATFPPYWGGTGNVAYYNALELARRGHEVTVITAAHPPGPYEYPSEIAVKRLPVGFRFGNAPFVPGLLNARGFDVIHLHHPFIFGAEMVSAVSRARDIPYVVTHHNDLIGDGLRRFAFRAYSELSSRLVFGAARKFAVVSVDHAVSCRLAGLFRKRWADVVEVPNGVDAESFRPGLNGMAVRRRHRIPDRASVILFVGALDRAHHFKGVPQLLRALCRLRDGDAVLMLVGDGDLREQLGRLALELGLSERVRFVGAVPHDRLPSYYAAADLLVMPSSPPESFGVVLIEAMACATPVIAHDIPGVRSVVGAGEDGLLVKPGDLADLSAKIETLLADGTLRARMGAAGRRKVEQRYCWPRIGFRLESVYQEILDSAFGAGNGPLPGRKRC